MTSKPSPPNGYPPPNHQMLALPPGVISTGVTTSVVTQWRDLLTDKKATVPVIPSGAEESGTRIPSRPPQREMSHNDTLSSRAQQSEVQRYPLRPGSHPHLSPPPTRQPCPASRRRGSSETPSAPAPRLCHSREGGNPVPVLLSLSNLKQNPCQWIRMLYLVGQNVYGVLDEWHCRELGWRRPS